MTILAAEVLQQAKNKEGRKKGKGDFSTPPTNEKNKHSHINKKKNEQATLAQTEGGKEREGGEWGNRLGKKLKLKFN